MKIGEMKKSALAESITVILFLYWTGHRGGRVSAMLMFNNETCTFSEIVSLRIFQIGIFLIIASYLSFAA